MNYFGFLTVMENPRHGLIGGYLILNHSGRPAEFHCTSPIRANRAQEILYGVTLEAYLYGEQIAQTLIQKSKIKPQAVLTNKLQVLAVREYIEIPIVYVFDYNATKEIKLLDPDEQLDAQSHDLPEVPGVNWQKHCIGRHEVAIEELTSCSSGEVQKALLDAANMIDLLEPFERICLAVEEAQKAA